MRKRPLQVFGVRIPDGKRYGVWAGKAVNIMLDYREIPVRISEFYGHGLNMPTRIVLQPQARKYILRQARQTMMGMRKAG
jgi:hypothetical protein